MPRRDFQRDLARASVPCLFAHLHDVRSGDEDGSIFFTYTAPFDTQTIDFQVSVPDTSQYPKYHTYFAFAASDTIPEAVSSALEQFQPADCALTVLEFLEYFSKCLDTAILDLASTTGSIDEIDVEDDVDSEIGGLSENEDEADWEYDETVFIGVRRDARTVVSEIREDLRIAKEAGYRVGYLGHVTGSVIISISCRIAKLGISVEAMKAWNVSPSDHLVLLLRYPQGYIQLKEIIVRSCSGNPSVVEMQVGACERYKPSLDEARKLFNASSKPSSDNNGKIQHPGASLKPIFIGHSLQSLLNNHFVNLLAYRLDHGFTWTGAELFLNNNQGRIQDKEAQDFVRPEYHVPEQWDESTPDFLKADHVYDFNWNTLSLSFPLLAMQFTLRRFVKCVGFCLNCYCKIESGFEALKPYVCSKGLCLYQYMKLGMGPNLEWEILSQPYVVDILVSFAYARASVGHLADFPTGLGLKIPCTIEASHESVHSGKLDLVNMRLQVYDSVALKAGDWIVLAKDTENPNQLDTKSQWHCRVMSSVYAPTYELASPIRPSNSTTLDMTPDVRFIVYDKDFDTLEDKNKRESICMLLDTLPDVDLMRSFLTGERVSERSLATWTERISPAALYVLRWIVASNRSCIMYEENPEDRVSGIPGWMQFRLAQGAPDKEHRFVHAVGSTTERLKLKHSTLFAWHGSALHNWHSILREGLHFKYTAHGRAYGDGVYMSNRFDYSLSYTDAYRSGSGTWPNSLLKVSKAIALNEVVNAPAEFVQSSACYVVRQLDWIQPRYLFVQSMDSGKTSDATTAKPEYVQDPNYPALGCQGKAVAVPLSALSSRRMAAANGLPKVGGRAKQVKSLAKDSKDNDDDTSSVITLLEDRMLLDWGTEEDLQKQYGEGDFYNRQRQESSLLTDFRPGTLREESVKLLGPPQYATTQATKALQQRLQETLKVQEREPLHELGWYMNHHLIENVYQWIVELHSFPPGLPLAQDLKKLGLTSVVLELRFPPQFPMSPPFVRVIRPRFVMFSQGGGGHITAGGALCMELLTSSGWSPVSSIEGVLLQVRMAITSTDPRPARLEMGNTVDYSVCEAIDAYMRVCQAHNWQVPADIQRVSWT
ncbi:putative ubiquitin conjugating enzyme [Aspergillus affinis]|uniref:putative ubiquitin conjugating enzyme n=1 Tax=Aspergillus affinis TaxID=1070780 RepID=UPI0022FE03E7|nr:uncharacterized protein KD926_000694 [Aspergillus affinis]KAI9037257.1 hypothetical protein KD926_000694 [Aspergillus affinis]